MDGAFLMRVLVHGLSSCIGGVESFLLNYCSVMAKASPHLTFEHIVYDEVPPYAEERGLDLSTLHVVPSRAASLRAHREGLRRVIELGAYDCIWGNFCSLSDIGPLMAARGSVPMRVAHAHSSRNMGTVVTAMLHALHRRSVEDVATDLLSCSHEAARFMFPAKLHHLTSPRIVPNGVDVDRFAFDEDARQQLRRAWGLDDALVLIYLGRFSPEKNPQFAVDVLQALRSQGVDGRLVMLGDGPQRAEVLAHVEREGLSDVVRMLGVVPDVERYLSAADVLVMPSLFEGLPLALVEAQASGLGCIVSEGVPAEALLVPHATRLALADPAEAWARCVRDLAETARDRRLSAPMITEAGFDMQNNGRELAEWFLDRWNQRRLECG